MAEASGATLEAKLLAAAGAGRMVTFTLPGWGDLVLSVERTDLDKLMAHWPTEDPGRRAHIIRSAKIALRKGLRRMRNQRATQHEADTFVQDAVIVLSHELVYGEGEKYLRKDLDFAAALSDPKKRRW